MHVCSVYDIQYDYPGLIGCEAQDALYRIFEMFDVETSAEDIYDEDYEVERSELVKLRSHIVEQDEEYRENEKEFLEQLKKAGINREKFITVLDRLINDSDQRNSEVHISWF
jgi:hypothetical protein